MKTIEDYVWFYYDQGFSVIPLGKRKDGDLKRPSCPEWKSYQSEKPSKQKIKAWLNDGSFVGIGIICGKVSGNLTIIDFDEEIAPAQLGIDLKNKKGWVVKTGKGYHMYSISEPPSPTKNDGIAKMDLKGEGGYVVAPPSKHASGQTYEFINATLGELPKGDTLKVFLDYTKKIKKIKGVKENPTVTKEDLKDGTAPCINLMLKGVENGRRNATLYALTSYYRFIKKLSREEVINQVWAWSGQLEEPMDRTELETSVDSVLDGEKSTGCTSITENGFCPYGGDKKQCPFFNRYKSFEKLQELSEFGVFSDKGKPLYPKLAELLIQKTDYNFTIVKDESTDKKDIFAYIDNYYQRVGSDIIRRLTIDYVGDITTAKIKDEVVSAVVDKSDSVDRQDIEPPKNLINLENGIFNIKTGKLIPHSSEYTFLQKTPVKYNSKAKCPNIMQFFDEVLKSKDIPIVQEMFGYCLYRGYDIGAVFYLFGTGRNGKGVTLKLLKRMVGKRNTCSRKLLELTTDVFAKADLFGKLVNVCGETSTKSIKNTGELKELSGEDWITAQRKYHGSFQFQNYAKLIFNMNEVPSIKDKTYGFLDRIRIVEYTKIFNSKNTDTKRDLFDNYLNTEAEIEGLLLWSLAGLKRLLKENCISGGEELFEMGDAYEQAVNYDFDWMNNNLKVTSDESYLTCDEILQKFQTWCDTNDRPRVTPNSFKGKLGGWVRMRGGVNTRKTVRGKKIRIYKKIAFKEDDEDDNSSEPDGKMKDIIDMCPASRKDLVERFSKEDIEHLLEQGILIKLPDGKLEVDV